MKIKEIRNEWTEIKKMVEGTEEEQLKEANEIKKELRKIEKDLLKINKRRK